MYVLDLYAGTGSATDPFKDRGHEVVTVELDPEDRFTDVDLKLDVRELARDPDAYLGDRRPDVLWASPPCDAFTMAGKGSYAAWERAKSPDEELSEKERRLKEDDPPLEAFRWHYRGHDGEPYPFYGKRLPNDEAARRGCSLVLATLVLVDKLEPRYWWLENPMGGLKTMGFMEDVPGPVKVTYCRYGEERMKATNLWGEWPEAWESREPCRNGGWGTVTVEGTDWRVGPNGEPCHHASPRGSDTGTQGRRTSAERAMVPYELGDEIAEAVETALGGS